MKTKQINKDVLKAMLAGERTVSREYRGRVCVGDDKAFAFPEPATVFLKLNDFSIQVSTLDTLVSKDNCYDVAHKNGIYLNGKTKLQELESQNNKCYVNAKYLNWFDADAEYHIKSGIDIVRVFEQGALVGLIAPCRYAREV